MLQRLELVGFKSFAERTRFEFAPGITAIVGPNGSGKSNVVDAVKWVLGEQSAKALRGGEMTDVIFNGSSTRRSVGMAEVSLTFDNSRQLLATDALEVQVTRRVYRDGEGEYLVNGQPARLKDVRDLFLGSGAGHGAYSVIEQGRVDALLMASPKDRRAIFEEAAGISRFKAKKLETLRKLDRVDADLVRVRDILAELDKQLRGLRAQAAKAERHRELAAELQRLRVAAARHEYRELSDALGRETAELDDMKAAATEADHDVSEGDAHLHRLDAAVREAEEARRGAEAKRADALKDLAGLDATAKHERVRLTGLETELYRAGKQRADALGRLRTLDGEAAACAREVEQATVAVAAEESRAAAADAALADETARIDAVQARARADRDRQMELAAAAAGRRAAADRLRADLARLVADREASAADAGRMEAELAEAEDSADDLARAEAKLLAQLDGARRDREEHLSYGDRLRDRAGGARAELEGWRERRSALLGRAEVLESWELGFEGFGAGVRDVLRRCAEGDAFLSSALGGLVGEFLDAPGDVAALVDLALGESAQGFALPDPSKLEAVAAALADAPGRVALIPRSEEPHEPTEGVTLAGFVRIAKPELRPFGEQLLGNVVLTEDLKEALASAARTRATRYVTRAGELLEPDGRLSLGPVANGTGIVSRKSELRDLRGRIAEHDDRIAALEAASAHARRQLDALDPPVKALDAEIAALAQEAAALRDHLRDRRQAADRTAAALDRLRADADRTEAAHRTTADALEGNATEAVAADAETADLRTRLDAATATLAAAEQVREQRRADHLRARVALERAREQRAALVERGERIAADADGRRQAVAALAAGEKAGRAKLVESQLAVLRATATAAGRCAAKEAHAANAGRATRELAGLRAERDRWLAATQRRRATTAERKELAHAREMAARDLTHRRAAVAARIAEDYALDLAALPDDDEQTLPPAEAEAAIAELRRKLARLGGVNAESLDELAGLETRERDLRTQHDDLADSHKKLLDIIEQLNGDSRTLFADTLAAVRVHFQELFRKLFGGGQADIVLEENVDPLESGIEVVARPPGKEPRNIGLLSGGERTLTAVALLLAIFRSKPSPFCLLDEVDAALDEANTARLAGALGEFLDKSQFIVVTHKKRTMAVADALYGVTMQESGVSKQVAVRFEDWPDDAETPQKAAA